MYYFFVHVYRVYRKSYFLEKKMKMNSFVIYLLTYISLTLLNYVSANTEIWRFQISDIKPWTLDQNNINSYPIIKPFQINTLSIYNVTNPHFCLLNSSSHSNKSIYLKLSWSAIDPIESFSNVTLYSLDNISKSDLWILSIDINLSHAMKYTNDNPLMLNLYVDDSGNLITYDLYPIITYITIVVLLLTLIFWTFGGIETILLNFI